MIVSSAFAFFFTSVETDGATLYGAYYSLEISGATDNSYTAPLAFEDKHVFKIKATGNATTGYCKIRIGEDTYYTEQINRDETLSLTVVAAKGTVIKFEPHWGSNTANRTISDTIKHSVTPSAPYTVEVTAKLEDIALYYGVSENDILTYNALTQIKVGDALKIPGVDPDTKPYAVPYAEYKVEPTADIMDIAFYYGIKEEYILTYNNISNITVGSVLKIPGVDRKTTPYAVSCVPLKITDGATLKGIAQHYGILESDILTYNNISALTIETTIRIPGATAATTPYVAPDPDPINNAYYQITTKNKLTDKDTKELLIYRGRYFDPKKDMKVFELVDDKEGQNYVTLRNKVKDLSFCFALKDSVESGYLKIIIGESNYYSVPIKKDSYVRLDISAVIGTDIRIEFCRGEIDPKLGITTFYGDDLKNEINEKNRKLDHTILSKTE